MDIVRVEDISALRRIQESPCISIFMPTHRAGVDTLQGPIRLKNCLREVEQKVAAEGHAAGDLLAPARKLLDDYDFWQHQSDGLAIYLAPGVQRMFRLPFLLQDLVVVGRRFHIKPVLQALTGEDRFNVLALSQKQVRLLYCTRFTQGEVELPEDVSGALTALTADTPEIQQQAHSAGAGGQSGAIFHGNPAGAEENKGRLLTRFQRLDRALAEIIGPDSAPLVVACVDYLFPIYRQASAHPRLCAEPVLGNPDMLRNDELRERAWGVAEPMVTSQRTRAIEMFREGLPSGRASSDVGAVVAGAADGRVDSLLVAVGVQQWGRFNPGTRQTEMHNEAQAGNEDLIDLAAILALERGGTVFAVPPDRMPDGLPLAAVFRY
jgi:hypothetical protein